MLAIARSKRVFMRLTRDIDCKMTPDASIIIVQHSQNAKKGGRILSLRPIYAPTRLAVISVAEF